MIIKLDTLAVHAKHAMSANTRVELNFPSPFLEKKGGKIDSNSCILENGKFGRMGTEASLFIIITTGKHAGSILVYHHLPVTSSQIDDNSIHSIYHAATLNCLSDLTTAIEAQLACNQPLGYL